MYLLIATVENAEHEKLWDLLVRGCWKGLTVGWGLVLGDSGEGPRK